ncbi:Ctr copper transporter [Microdochium trichocladiopsis]|uniref:Copper transport protein n=1 Tax=Microdochium trichocladiopsis TaxID=1682393 RepID=A0A9P8YG91_9PEZI|nr:Ctr copper transporter [Microdochium trichocladiopsis]KAH7037388.1 Ctr copper transporter [Microdochium trichocladiopsis]
MDHSSMDMDMDMGGTDPSSSSHNMQMMSIFQTSMSTSLYSASWTPTTTAGYAGTCIFLILLALGFRLLLWGKTAAEARWLDAEIRRRYVVVQGKPRLAERVSRDGDAKRATLVLSENGVEEDVVVLQKNIISAVTTTTTAAADDDNNNNGADATGGRSRSVLGGQHARPWRMSVDPLRALFDTVIVGVGYLLMLAVMTMNVGYFLSILAGTFLGSLLVGRFTGLVEH